SRPPRPRLGRRLVTERLVLRPLRPADEETLLRHWNDPQVRRYLLDGGRLSPAMVRRQIAASMEDFRWIGCGSYLLLLRPRARVAVGFAGVRPFGDRGAIEILYALRPQYRGAAWPRRPHGPSSSSRSASWRWARSSRARTLPTPPPSG
ncbi:MAG TPA: GNAT family N-acetyltransferase, partial [Vicinamibacteria bacterium]|nr:GNAT family N-acetyltransferase [Vicinamibacteria bacterium]